MSAGLFTKFNLSEDGLNATDALQKLYGPQIQDDVNLFAFAGRLESTISSASVASINQIRGLVNEPYKDGNGNEILRTRFVTNSYTFSSENLVWFDRIDGVFFDQRGPNPTAGAPIYVSDTDKIVNLSVEGAGTQYEARDAEGTELSYPATVTVNLLGLESGANNATAQVTVNANGTLSRTITIVSGGSGYVPNEYLQPIPSCGPEDEPVEDKCIRYAANSLYHVTYSSGSVGYSALIRNERYLYTVKSANQDGFFLYDDISDDWVYLGTVYNSIQLLPALPAPGLRFGRLDTLSSENLVQLYKLDGRSQFYSYFEGYEPGTNLSSSIRSISNSIESVRNSLPNFVQNVKIQSDDTELGFTYNRFKGFNVQSDYRVIFRDPDGVIDDPLVTFFDLRDQTNELGQVRIGGIAMPGIWLFTGEKYQRVFSTDDKPFFSQSGRNYLSPILAKFESGSVVSALETGDNKYSISAGYYKPGTPIDTNSVIGFDTSLGTLIQNLSSDSDPDEGGFVYHRTLTVAFNIRGIVDSWPLFSYSDNGVVKDAKILAI
jgi:hypothetical protein